VEKIEVKILKIIGHIYLFIRTMIWFNIFVNHKFMQLKKEGQLTPQTDK